MATTFYPIATTIAATSSTWSNSPTTNLLSLGVRGAGAQTQTDATVASLAASFVAGAQVAILGVAAVQQIAFAAGRNWTTGTILFVTNPLDAVTISGQITANLRGSESNAMANYVNGCELLSIAPSGGAQSHREFFTGSAELGTTEGATSIAVTPTSFSITAGSQLILAIGYCGIGTSASGFTASGFYAGTAGGASGDAFITFAETITEQAVAGRVPYVPPQMPSLLAQ